MSNQSKTKALGTQRRCKSSYLKPWKWPILDIPVTAFINICLLVWVSFKNCVDSGTACSQSLPDSGNVHYQSLIMYNRETCMIPCLFFCLLSTTKWNQCIFRSNDFTKFTFYSFLHNVAHKDRWILEKYCSFSTVYSYLQTTDFKDWCTNF